MSKIKRETKTVSIISPPSKPCEKDTPITFHHLLTKKLPNPKIDRVSKRLDKIKENVFTDLLLKKNQNVYFIELLTKNKSNLNTIDFLDSEFVKIENQVALGFNSEQPKVNLKIEIRRLKNNLRELTNKTPTKILLSPASRRKASPRRQ